MIKSFVTFLAVAIMLTAANQAMAFGGGGGKTPTSATITVINNDAMESLEVWIRPAGTPIPATNAELLPLLVNVPAGGSFAQVLSNGDFEITTVLSASLMGPLPSDPVDITLAIADDDFTVSGVNFPIFANSLVLFIASP